MKRQSYVRSAGLLIAVAILAGAWAQALAQEDKAAEAAGPIENFIEKSKQPVSWLKWGADLRLREVWENNMRGLDKNTRNHDRHWQRYRLRLGATVTPIEDIDINIRSVWEPRHYCRPESADVWQRSEVVFDKMNVVWRNPFGLPTTLKAGRQDIKLGDGWLVYEGTPTDGSRTIYFDAIRLTTQLKSWNTTVDTIFIDQKSQGDRHLPVYCDKDVRVTEQDEHGFILYVANRSLGKTEIDGYYILKIDRNNRQVATSRDGYIHTFGARVAHTFSKKLKGKVEFADQLGKRDGQTVCAFAFNSRLTYSLNDTWSNSFRLDYEYASGDDPGSGTNEQFDAVWGRWWRLSDIITYVYTRETRYTDPTNFHRIGPGWSSKPHKKLALSADYNLLFADQNSLRGNAGFSDNGCFRGQLLVAKLVYKFNKYIKGHLTGQVFFPGDYYSDARNDPALFLRYELVFTW